MKKNKLIFMQIFIAFVLICTSVYAASTTIGVSASKSTVNRGDEVVVTLSLKNVDSSKKVESIEGYINYNKNIIETISVDNIQKETDNTVKIGNETLKVEDLTNADPNNLPTTTSYVAFNGSPASGKDSKIVIDFKDGITADTDILKINFKVKSDATIGEIKNAIEYSMFVITAGSEQSEEITKNVDLTVKAVEQNNGNENKNNTNSNTNTNTNTNTNSNNNSNTNKNNTNTNSNTNKNNSANTNSNTNKSNSVGGNTSANTANKTLPKTGAKIIIMPAILLIVLTYICYYKYNKYKGV